MEELQRMKMLVAAQDSMHLAGLTTVLGEIDKRRIRKNELQGIVEEYNRLEEEIIELRKNADRLTRDMTFRSPYAGYPDYADTPFTVGSETITARSIVSDEEKWKTILEGARKTAREKLKD